MVVQFIMFPFPFFVINVQYALRPLKGSNTQHSVWSARNSHEEECVSRRAGCVLGMLLFVSCDEQCNVMEITV